MATIDKTKFQFVKRDDFASETIDAPAYSYWKSVMRQFLKEINSYHVGNFGRYYFDEFHLSDFLRF